MRVYHGAPSPENLRRCREAAPSHVHGACWTPAKMTPHEWPYFIDCGAFGGNFDREEWLALLDRVDGRMPHAPAFVVLPDVFNDAEATLERHRVHADDVLSRGFDPAPVLQPGLPVASQVAIADGFGAETVFVGGEVRWQRAHAEEIVAEAHERDIRVHIGNPGDSESLAWAYRVGFDSVDTSSVLQNQYFHWLENLEDESHSNTGGRKKESQQQQLVTDGGVDRSESVVLRRNREAEHIDEPGWAIWLGTRRDDECVAVVADTQQEAERKALEQSEYDEVRHVDGPRQNADPGVWEFEYVTEHRERVVVEAPDEEYASEIADSERDHRGQYVQTVHESSRRLRTEDD